MTIFLTLPFKHPYHEGYSVEGIVTDDEETYYYLKGYLIAYDNLLLVAVVHGGVKQDFLSHLETADEVVRRARVLK